jgi:hypothetical protein
VTAPTFFEQALADYRKGLEWRQHYDEYLDSLGPRAGICAEDAAAEYADEMMEEAEPLVEIEHLGPGRIAA